MKCQRIDLIPPEIHDRRARRRHLRVWAFLLTVLISAQACAVVYLRFRYQQVKDCVGRTSELRQVAQVVQKNNQALTERIAEAKEQLARLDLLANKHLWSRMLNWLSETCPEAVILTSLRVDADVGRPGGPRAAKVRPGEQLAFDDLPMPHSLILSGYAADHPNLLQFIGRLKESETFGSVSLVQTRREPLGSSEAVVFTILCQW
jgi:Tfp pilus assembly protein PilN